MTIDTLNAIEKELNSEKRYDDARAVAAVRNVFIDTFFSEAAARREEARQRELDRLAGVQL